MIATIEIEAADAVPLTGLCLALGVGRATVYRHREGHASAPETDADAAPADLVGSDDDRDRAALCVAPVEPGAADAVELVHHQAAVNLDAAALTETASLIDPAVINTALIDAASIIDAASTDAASSDITGIGTATSIDTTGIFRAAIFGAAELLGTDTILDPAVTIAAPRRRRPSPRALGPDERQEVLDLLHHEDNVDKSPEALLAELRDEGRYLCSVRTARRILADAGEIKERRPQRTHPTYARPELMATGPRQVWTWDITYLRGPRKGVYYYLYVIVDIYSRYVVGWLLGQVESTDLAHQLIEETFRKEGVLPGELVLHADRGSVPASTGLDKLFEDLGLTRSHSRPRVSNDNPYSESFFRTGKYHPTYPGRFHDYEHALAWCRAFFPWYNDQHRHSGICYLTPSMVHHGRADALLEVHATALREGYERHPERFVHGPPAPPRLPVAVYINKPESLH